VRGLSFSKNQSINILKLAPFWNEPNGHINRMGQEAGFDGVNGMSLRVGIVFLLSLK